MNTADITLTTQQLWEINHNAQVAIFKTKQIIADRKARELPVGTFEKELKFQRELLAVIKEARK